LKLKNGVPSHDTFGRLFAQCPLTLTVSIKAADNVIIILERRGEMAIDDELAWYLAGVWSCGSACRVDGLLSRADAADQEEEH